MSPRKTMAMMKSGGAVKKMRGGGMVKKMRGGGMAKKMRGGGMVKKLRGGGMVKKMKMGGDTSLSGNQKKLDANKNGKIDKQDFKMLAKKKKKTKKNMA